MRQHQIELVADVPAAVDSLNAKTSSLAASLAQAILSSSSPLCIGIYGGWGSGKTTLLKLTEAAVKQNHATDADHWLHTVYFESWRHSPTPEPLAPLLAQILRTIEGDVQAEFKNTIGAVITSLLASVKIKTGIVELVVKDAQDAARQAKIKPSEVAERIIASADNGFGELMKKFEHLMADGRNRLIIFIDDLDRCGPEGLGILRAAKTLLPIKGIVTVFGLNPIPLRNWLTEYGNDSNGKSGAEDFLEKVFTLTINVPTHQDQDRGSLHATLMTHLLKLNKNTDEVHHIVWPAASKCTIRQLKRIFNEFIVLYSTSINRAADHFPGVLFSLVYLAHFDIPMLREISNGGIAFLQAKFLTESVQNMATPMENFIQLLDSTEPNKEDVLRAWLETVEGYLVNDRCE